MKYAIQVRYAPDDWLFVTEGGSKRQLFESKEEAETFRRIWNGEVSRVVEVEDEEVNVDYRCTCCDWEGTVDEANYNEYGQAYCPECYDDELELADE